MKGPRGERVVRVRTCHGAMESGEGLSLTDTNERGSGADAVTEAVRSEYERKEVKRDVVDVV